MAVEITNNGEQITALLSGDIDHHNLAHIRSEIDTHLEKSTPKLLILDFSGVNFMDSSGIGLILGRMRVLERFGGSIAIKNTGRLVSKIIKLAGLGELIIDGKAEKIIK